ncbi:MAG TPA: HypC/HybG/HupF family hydrogenase formation chaperone [Thermoplasmata archaeon]|nr:HypC/HybG/HupF family hydrogenase formation chaperone [Thermoplasmata archaeon]HUJ77675.1 HypC/HybG/HupF family hydrogenase formation chaperone [Thermoplasmata archaeon]
MCLTIPGRIVSVDRTDAAAPTATIDFDGLVRTASLLYLPDAAVGEFVMVQAGFAMRRVPADEAREALGYARAMAAPAVASGAPP